MPWNQANVLLALGAMVVIGAMWAGAMIVLKAGKQDTAQSVKTVVGVLLGMFVAAIAGAWATWGGQIAGWLANAGS